MDNKNIQTVSSTREPLFHLSKRAGLSTLRKAGIYGIAILVAVVIASIFMLLNGINPIQYFSVMIFKNFENTLRLRGLISSFVPLLFVSLGLLFSFKMKFWNIGAEGQFLMGGLLAFTVALWLGDSLPSILGVLVVLLSGVVGSALFGLIPALLKTKFNTNETLLTLMLNYIALNIVNHCLYSTTFYVQPSNGIKAFKIIAESLWLTPICIGNTYIGDSSMIVCILALAFTIVYFKYFKQGYEVRVVGDSLNSARYAGMKVNWIIIRTMIISASLIGLAASFKLTGVYASNTISISFTGGIGWTAIIICWLAGLSPIGVGVVSFFFAIMQNGGGIAEINMGVQSSITDMLQAIILFCVLTCAFFIRYQVAFRTKKTNGGE